MRPCSRALALTLLRLLLLLLLFPHHPGVDAEISLRRYVKTRVPAWAPTASHSQVKVHREKQPNPTNIGTTRATPTSTPLVVISDRVKILVAVRFFSPLF